MKRILIKGANGFLGRRLIVFTHYKPIFNTVQKKFTKISGLNNEAVTAKGMNLVSTFGICIKKEAQNILGGGKGAVLYGNLYVDALWINKKIRHQEWGAKLMAEAKNR